MSIYTYGLAATATIGGASPATARRGAAVQRRLAVRPDQSCLPHRPASTGTITRLAPRGDHIGAPAEPDLATEDAPDVRMPAAMTGAVKLPATVAASG